MQGLLKSRNIPKKLSYILVAALALTAVVAVFLQMGGPASAAPFINNADIPGYKTAADWYNDYLTEGDWGYYEVGHSALGYGGQGIGNWNAVMAAPQSKIYVKLLDMLVPHNAPVINNYSTQRQMVIPAGKTVYLDFNGVEIHSLINGRAQTGGSDTETVNISLINNQGTLIMANHGAYSERNLNFYTNPPLNARDEGSGTDTRENCSLTVNANMITNSGTLYIDGVSFNLDMSGDLGPNGAAGGKPGNRITFNLRGINQTGSGVTYWINGTNRVAASARHGSSDNQRSAAHVYGVFMDGSASKFYMTGGFFDLYAQARSNNTGSTNNRYSFATAVGAHSDGTIMTGGQMNIRAEIDNVNNSQTRQVNVAGFTYNDTNPTRAPQNYPTLVGGTVNLYRQGNGGGDSSVMTSRYQEANTAGTGNRPIGTPGYGNGFYKDGYGNIIVADNSINNFGNGGWYTNNYATLIPPGYTKLSTNYKLLEGNLENAVLTGNPVMGLQSYRESHKLPCFDAGNTFVKYSIGNQVTAMGAAANAAPDMPLDATDKLIGNGAIIPANAGAVLSFGAEFASFINPLYIEKTEVTGVSVDDAFLAAGSLPYYPVSRGSGSVMNVGYAFNQLGSDIIKITPMFHRDGTDPGGIPFKYTDPPNALGDNAFDYYNAWGYSLRTSVKMQQFIDGIMEIDFAYSTGKILDPAIDTDDPGFDPDDPANYIWDWQDGKPTDPGVYRLKLSTGQEGSEAWAYDIPGNPYEPSNPWADNQPYSEVQFNYNIRNERPAILITSSPALIFVDEAVTFTADVLNADGGTVTFFIDNKPYGSAVPVDGTLASINIPGGLSFGSHDVKAVYVSGAIDAEVTQVFDVDIVNVMTFTADPAGECAEGTPVTFTAALNMPGATGTVDFLVDGALKGTAAVVNGSASITVTDFTAVNTYAVQAKYSGDSRFDPLNSAIMDYTVKYVTSIALSVSETAPLLNGNVILTANVTPDDIGGIVNFYDGAKLITTAVVDASGVAVAEVAFDTSGAHNVYAVLQSTDEYASCKSNTVTLTVSQTPSKLPISCYTEYCICAEKHNFIRCTICWFRYAIMVVFLNLLK